MKNLLWAVIIGQIFLLQGCALDAMEPKPDDPQYAPALPEDDYAAVVPTGGIYNPYTSSNGMYSDTSAHRVGDIISVNLEEATRASKNAGTTLEKNNSLNIGGANIFGQDVHLGKYQMFPLTIQAILTDHLMQVKVIVCKVKFQLVL